MKQYLDLMQDVIDNGVIKSDRTGTGTVSLFGYQVRYDLQKGFPLLTTKKVHFPSIAHELLWFLKGDTNIKYLKDNKVKIWDEWADENGNLGPIYGKQWRRWKTTGNNNYIDQISEVLKQIKETPDSRRMIVSAWNVGELESMALPPCHTLFQFYVADGKLSCQLYQRSADIFLGVPFNVASYSLLVILIAKMTGLRCGEFIHSIGDAHLYLNHMEQVKLQLSRKTRSLPNIVLNPDIKDLFDFRFEDIKLDGYNPHPLIKGKVAI